MVEITENQDSRIAYEVKRFGEVKSRELTAYLWLGGPGKLV